MQEFARKQSEPMYACSQECGRACKPDVSSGLREYIVIKTLLFLRRKAKEMEVFFVTKHKF
jgi:hypothetical protein